MTAPFKGLFWLDLEMTGLDETKDQILEVAAIVTDYHFNSVGTYEAIVYQPQSVLDNMNDWCKEHHGKSGLSAKVPHGKPIAEVETALIAMAEKHFPGKDNRPVLAGNSISNDRRFVDAYLKGFSEKLHYRLVDVSSFKEIFRERYGFRVDKKGSHRALEDIQESIIELKTYLKTVNLTPIL